MPGSVDLWSSRRTNFMRCEYWRRDNSIKDKSEYAHLKSPDGVFQAREEAAFAIQNSQVGGMFIFDENTVTMMTSDSVDLKVNDIVSVDGEPFIVQNVQKREVRKRSQFLKSKSVVTYFQIRR